MTRITALPPARPDSSPMIDLIQTLKDHYSDDPCYVNYNNILIFYEKGHRRRRLAPDVFVVRGIPKEDRGNYLTWEEGRGPDLMIEVTSTSTRREDERTKRDLYRDVLRVSEYFLFDPPAEYLKPPFQDYRLADRDYAPIGPVAGRLPSEAIYSPALGRWPPTAVERLAEEVAARLAAEAEIERLRREMEALRRPGPNGAG